MTVHLLHFDVPIQIRSNGTMEFDYVLSNSVISLRFLNPSEMVPAVEISQSSLRSLSCFELKHWTAWEVAYWVERQSKESLQKYTIWNRLGAWECCILFLSSSRQDWYSVRKGWLCTGRSSRNIESMGRNSSNSRIWPEMSWDSMGLFLHWLQKSRCVSLLFYF